MFPGRDAGTVRIRAVPVSCSRIFPVCPQERKKPAGRP
ncbi:hypothetical protein BACCAP_04854 [Pseudoflavonifractor capillosus ATCC 29799]|uniref:Uncharacterized protein n=1 Tax=Pseudoflavonifractor capillosus ATCC 29799 TaxID=411467 RepID=A6P2X0_9FIRM|nr:hypothetical protein BACCAP_04854 [Pseudoflavonifractor capillosus ATCC 29799]